MARRLNAIGQRPISALVDITNYVMFDLGRPLHAYDIDKIHGNELIVRPAAGGESFAALNEKTYEMEAGMITIGDAEGVDDLAGVMGGERTGVSDGTTGMFIDSSSRRNSDASRATAACCRRETLMSSAMPIAPTRSGPA